MYTKCLNSMSITIDYRWTLHWKQLFVSFCNEQCSFTIYIRSFEELMQIMRNQIKWNWTMDFVVTLFLAVASSLSLLFRPFWDRHNKMEERNNNNLYRSHWSDICFELMSDSFTPTTRMIDWHGYVWFIWDYKIIFNL